MNNLMYSLIGDYKLPDLTLPEEPPVVFGKYALLRKQYLKQHRRVLYINYLTAGTLHSHLVEIDRQSNDMMEHLVQQMAESEGVTERLKAEDQMAWVGRMNSIRHRAEEIVYQEIIYS